MDILRSVARVVSDAIRALKPYGVTPIVSVVLAFLGVAGLSLGASPFGVVAVIGMAFGAFFVGQERSAVWRRRELELQYDALETKDGAAVRKKLNRRLQETRKRNQPGLFDVEESTNARDH